MKLIEDPLNQDSSQYGAPSENFIDETIEERRPYLNDKINNKNQTKFSGSQIN